MAEMTAATGGMPLDDADAYHRYVIDLLGLLPVRRLAIFEAGDVGQESVDLARREGKAGHGRMTHDNAFGQGFLEVFDWIALGQVAERRREPHRACTCFAHGMTAGAVFVGNRLASRRRRRLCQHVSRVQRERSERCTGAESSDLHGRALRNVSRRTPCARSICADLDVDQGGPALTMETGGIRGGDRYALCTRRRSSAVGPQPSAATRA